MSRQEHNIWINVQLKVENDESLKKASRIVDLVGGMNGFFHEFITLHLMDDRSESFSSEQRWKLWQTGNEDADDLKTSESQGLVEFTWSRLLPPFDSDFHEYSDEYKLMYSGDMWLDFADRFQHLEFDREAQPDSSESPLSFEQWRDRLLSEKERVEYYQKVFETVMADQFELARLMVYLPSYIDFMYDLVIKERKEIGHELVRMSRRKKKKTKIVRKPIYKMIKSLRISYLAEEETRQKLNIPQRKWTAPSYRFTVRGHWRRFSQPSWVGHDQYGNKLQGRTWVKDYDKGAGMEQVQVGTRSPNVVIKLKQPLAYARDVIKSHEKARTAIVPRLHTTHIQSRKPSKEWMYQERIKLTAGLRWIILRRDGFKCTVCGKGSEDGVKLEVDHVVPIEK